MTGMTGMGGPGVGRSLILCGRTQSTAKAGVTVVKDVPFQVNSVIIFITFCSPHYLYREEVQDGERGILCISIPTQQ